MTMMRSIFLILFAAIALLLIGCVNRKPVPYGTEVRYRLPGDQGEVWAVAPALNLSGEPGVDPLLQADLLYQQLQHVQGLTIIPVNRTLEAYQVLGIERIESEAQAREVCLMLGSDALVVPTVTIFDPYNPPKMGAALQLFGADHRPDAPAIDPRELTRQASPHLPRPLPADPAFGQVVGMFDAANGSVRDKLKIYAAGRHEPLGPLGVKEYYMHMDRFAGFVYHTLLGDLIAGIHRGS